MWACWDMQKIEVSQDPETFRKVRSRKDLPMEKWQFKEHLNKLEMCKFMGPDGTYSPRLCDLAHVIAGPSE